MENITGADSEHSKALVLGHGSERFLPKSYQKTPSTFEGLWVSFHAQQYFENNFQLLALSDLD
jgi:hypothetical protein